MKEKINYYLFAALTILTIGCSTIPKSVSDWRSNLKTIQIENETMAYRTYGDISKPAVILLHGLPTSSYLYRNIAPEVAAKGYFVITPDFVGFGASSKPEDYDSYQVKRQAERVKILLNELKINSFSIVAHDLGGLVGFELLITDSSHIPSFLVLNTTAYKEGFNPPSEMNMLAGWMGGMMSYMMSNNLTGRFLTSKFIKDNMGQPDKLPEEAKDNYWWPMHEGATFPMRATAKSFDQIMDRYKVYQEAIKKYSGHVRILWGSKDKVLNFEKLSGQFARDFRISKDNVKSTDQASHFIQEDNPELVTENILKNLENK